MDFSDSLFSRTFTDEFTVFQNALRQPENTQGQQGEAAPAADNAELRKKRDEYSIDIKKKKTQTYLTNKRTKPLDRLPQDPAIAQEAPLDGGSNTVSPLTAESDEDLDNDRDLDNDKNLDNDKAGLKKKRDDYWVNQRKSVIEKALKEKRGIDKELDNDDLSEDGPQPDNNDLSEERPQPDNDDLSEEGPQPDNDGASDVIADIIGTGSIQGSGGIRSYDFFVPANKTCEVPLPDRFIKGKREDAPSEKKKKTGGAKAKKAAPAGDDVEDEPDTDPWHFQFVLYNSWISGQDEPADDKEFVLYWKNGSTEFYMLAEDLKSRLTLDLKALEMKYNDDVEAIQTKGIPFATWKLDGKPAKAPAISILKPKLFPPETTKAQLDKWIEAGLYAEKKTTTFNHTIARFWDTPTSDLILRIEASSQIKVDRLHLLVSKAKDKCRFKPVITEANIVEAGHGGDGGYVRIGEHLLGLWSLWAPKESIKALAAKDSAQRLPPRTFPTYKMAEMANVKLYGPLISGPPRPTAKMTETSLSDHKVGSTIGVKRKDDQKKVMNNVSATDLCEIFEWPKEGQKKNNQNQAEWLHRSAFSFGGLGRINAPQSSQVQDNLIFGTKEANTFMIRPESTIKHMTILNYKRIRDFKKAPGKDKKQDRIGRGRDKIVSTVGTALEYRSSSADGRVEQATKPAPLAELRVAEDSDDEIIEEENSTTKTQATQQSTQAAPASQQNGQIAVEPNVTQQGEKKKKGRKWAERSAFPWLALQLRYDVQFEVGNGRCLNSSLRIKPFDRIRPMRFEAELDKLVEEEIFAPKKLPADFIEKLQDRDERLKAKREERERQKQESELNEEDEELKEERTNRPLKAEPYAEWHATGNVGKYKAGMGKSEDKAKLDYDYSPSVAGTSGPELGPRKDKTKWGQKQKEEEEANETRGKKVTKQRAFA